MRKVGVADSGSKRPRSCMAPSRGDPGRKAEGNFVKEDDGANKNETNDTIIPLSAAAMVSVSITTQNAMYFYLLFCTSF